jgi:Mu-like prophage I protein
VEDEPMDEFKQSLKQALGLADEADDAAILEAVKKAAENQATMAKVVTAARLTAGYTEADLLAIVMERTVGGATAMAKLQDELTSVKAAHAVDKAIAAGKFTVADREDCLKDAKLNLEAFEKVVARRAPVAPVHGEPPPGTNEEPTKSVEHEKDEREFKIKLTASDAALSKREREVLRQMAPHINPEAWLEDRRAKASAERSHLR